MDLGKIMMGTWQVLPKSCQDLIRSCPNCYKISAINKSWWNLGKVFHDHGKITIQSFQDFSSWFVSFISFIIFVRFTIPIPITGPYAGYCHQGGGGDGSNRPSRLVWLFGKIIFWRQIKIWIQSFQYLLKFLHNYWFASLLRGVLIVLYLAALFPAVLVKYPCWASVSVSYLFG